jgi:uncharacterized protein HemX
VASDEKDIEKGAELHPNRESATNERGQTGSLRALIALLAAAGIALGFFIYSGIRSRLQAASILQRTTEEAAITDVVCSCPSETESAYGRNRAAGRHPALH